MFFEAFADSHDSMIFFVLDLVFGQLSPLFFSFFLMNRYSIVM